MAHDQKFFKLTLQRSWKATLVDPAKGKPKNKAYELVDVGKGEHMVARVPNPTASGKLAAKNTWLVIWPLPEGKYVGWLEAGILGFVKEKRTWRVSIEEAELREAQFVEIVATTTSSEEAVFKTSVADNHRDQERGATAITVAVDPY